MPFSAQEYIKCHVVGNGYCGTVTFHQLQAPPHSVPFGTKDDEILYYTIKQSKKRIGSQNCVKILVPRSFFFTETGKLDVRRPPI